MAMAPRLLVDDSDSDELGRLLLHHWLLPLCLPLPVFFGAGNMAARSGGPRAPLGRIEPPVS
ncbi:hypothetical protein E2562_018676 [Oryza meyeriana var. granulata]|uniref:Uncharacterized protein n=1 Tax=Oryza meyeriana var. granulata TaxID=110450 RepID=A0A6G1EMM2_9ORYZ|nr:hypothetical protein E2562_018676 [Oryza meyeriana var. granulata]